MKINVDMKAKVCQCICWVCETNGFATTMSECDKSEFNKNFWFFVQ